MRRLLKPARLCPARCRLFHPDMYIDYFCLFVASDKCNKTNKQTKKTSCATVTGCAPAVRDLLVQLAKLNCKKKIQRDWKFHDLNICPNILQADADADTDAGGIEIALLHRSAGALKKKKKRKKKSFAFATEKQNNENYRGFFRGVVKREYIHRRRAQFSMSAQNNP